MNVHPSARFYCLSTPHSVAPSRGGVALLIHGGVVRRVVLHDGLADEVDLDVRAENRAQILSDVPRYRRVVDLAGGKSGRRFGTESRKHCSFLPVSGNQSSFL
jgi:hypothetical protein